MPDSDSASRSISDGNFNFRLQNYWEEIALFAYEQFQTHGKGVVFIDRNAQTNSANAGQIELGYATYGNDSSDTQTVRMIDDYDPDWEIVFQYMRPDGNVRSRRVRTGPENRNPGRVYLFERVIKEMGEG